MAKRTVIALGTLSLAVAAFANPVPSPAPKEQYTATVQLLIEEPTPQLLQRAKNLVRRELESTFRAWPSLEVKKFELQSSGNQVYLSVLSDKDIQQPVQEALASVVTHLDGKVWALGRSDIHRTSLSQPVEAFLGIQLVETADELTDLSQVRIERIGAIAIPVREFLRELKFRIRERHPRLPVFGHSIDRSCAERDLDWSFGETSDEAPKDLKSVMEELAAVLNVPGGVKQINGRYVFAGGCPPQEAPIRRRLPGPPGLDGVMGEMQPNNVSFSPDRFSVHSVHIPLMPLGKW